MTDRDLEIVEVSTTRIGPSPKQNRDRGSRRPLSVVIVILVALVIPVLAFMGPRGEQRLDLSYLIATPVPATPAPSPTRTPRPTPTPRPPTPSPPPVVTTGNGPVPVAIPVDVGGIRLVDPSTGELGPPGTMRSDSDAVFRGPNGGWSCVCFGRTQHGQSESLEIVVRYLDSSAIERSGAAIATVESVADPPAQDFDTHVDVALSPDGQVAYVALAARRLGGWTISLAAIDIRHGTLIGQKDMASVDVPTPTAEEVNNGYGTWLAGPFLRLSPDGDRLLLYRWLEKSTATASERHAVSLSVIDVSGAGRGAEPFGVTTAMGGAITETIATCGWLQWLDEASLLGLCWRELQGPGESATVVTTFGLDGARVASIDYSPDPINWIADPVLDVANRRLYVWSPVGHQLDVIGIDSGRVETLEVEPDGSSTISGDPIGQAAQWPGWDTMTSDYVPWSMPPLLADPRGTRLFAVGMKEGPMNSNRGQWLGSTGIFVFDTAALELADQWPAAAPYVGLAMSREGRWIYAISQGGADTDGNESGWPPIVSVHDATDGRLAVQLARFGTDQPLLFAP